MSAAYPFLTHDIVQIGLRRCVKLHHYDTVLMIMRQNLRKTGIKMRTSKLNQAINRRCKRYTYRSLASIIGMRQQKDLRLHGKQLVDKDARRWLRRIMVTVPSHHLHGERHDFILEKKSSS